MIAQIDEEHAAMIADAVDPTCEADRFAYMLFAKIGAGMAAVSVHLGSPLEKCGKVVRRYIVPRPGSQAAGCYDLAQPERRAKITDISSGGPGLQPF
jgi:hypothetical protein